MKVFKKIIGLLTVSILLNITALAPLAAGIEDPSAVETVRHEITSECNSFTQKGIMQKAVKKAGWFKKGKYKYYRMKNGKLCTKKYAKINGKYYSFDSKGRMKTGLVAFSKGEKAYFSKKDGHFVNYVKDMVVVEKSNGNITAKDSQGLLFGIHLTKIVNRNGKEIPESMIKKKSKIQVFYKGGVLETYPAQFQNAYKIKVVN